MVSSKNNIRVLIFLESFLFSNVNFSQDSSPLPLNTKKRRIYKAHIYTKDSKREKGILFDVSDSAVLFSPYHSRAAIRKKPAKEIMVKDIEIILLKDTKAIGRTVPLGIGIGFGVGVTIISVARYQTNQEFSLYTRPITSMIIVELASVLGGVISGILADSRHLSVRIEGKLEKYKMVKTNLKSYCFLK